MQLADTHCYLDNRKPALPCIIYAKTFNKTQDDDDEEEGYPRHPNCAVLKQKFYISVLANMSSGTKGSYILILTLLSQDVLQPNPSLLASPSSTS